MGGSSTWGSISTSTNHPTEPVKYAKPTMRSRLMPQKPRRHYNEDEQNLLELMTDAAEPRKPPKEFMIRFGMLLLTLFLFFLTFSIFTPFFPQAAAEKGMSTFLVGFVFAIYELTAAIAQPVSGSTISFFGCKFMMFGGVVFTAGATLLYSLLEWCPAGTSFAVLSLVLRSVQAIGCGMVQSVIMTLGTTWFPHDISMVFGLMEITVSIGGMLGASLGGVLYDVGGFYLPFLVTGSMFLVLGLPVSIFAIPPNAMPPHQTDSEDQVTMGRILRVPQIWPPLISMFLCSFVFVGIQPIISPALQAAGIKTYTDVSMIILLGSAGGAVSALTIAAASDRVERPIIFTVILSGIIFLGFTLLGNTLWFSSVAKTSTTSIIGYLLSISCITGAYMPVAKEVKGATLLGGVPDNMEANARISGLYNGVYFSGGFIGPMLSGILVENFGFDTTMLIFAVVSLIAGLVALGAFLFIKTAVEEEGDKIKVVELRPDFSRQVSRLTGNSVMYSSTYGQIFSSTVTQRSHTVT